MSSFEPRCLGEWGSQEEMSEPGGLGFVWMGHLAARQLLHPRTECSGGGGPISASALGGVAVRVSSRLLNRTAWRSLPQNGVHAEPNPHTLDNRQELPRLWIGGAGSPSLVTHEQGDRPGPITTTGNPYRPADWAGESLPGWQCHPGGAAAGRRRA